MAPQRYLDIDVSMVKKAELADIPRIAHFMYTYWNEAYDPEEVLCRQTEERIKDGYGRTKYAIVKY